MSAPAGYGVVLRSKKFVGKMTHAFFITINSMILYFKHIIHIDDFPLTGHPPSILLGGWVPVHRAVERDEIPYP